MTDHRFEQAYRVRFDEADPTGTVRSSSYLRYAQDVAACHSEDGGFDRAWYAERSLTWLVRCLELEILEPVSYGMNLAVSTEVVGFRRSWARRRSEFRPADGGRPAASALIDWLLVGPGGAPRRIPPELSGFAPPTPTGFTPARLKLDPPPASVDRRRLLARPQDLDPMGHVNNAVYLDWLEEALALAGRDELVGCYPRRYRLEYVRAAGPRLELETALWPDDRGWACLLRDPDGRDLLHGHLESDPAASVGG